MCNACGNPAAPGHWTEAGADTPGDRLRARFHRAGLLDKVLRPFGLTAHDGGLVPGIQMGTLSGNQTIVPDLATSWETKDGGRKLPVPPGMHNRGNVIVSLGAMCAWLAPQAEALGVDVFAGFTGAQLLIEDGKVRMWFHGFSKRKSIEIGYAQAPWPLKLPP